MTSPLWMQILKFLYCPPQHSSLLYGLTLHYKHPNLYLSENLCVRVKHSTKILNNLNWNWGQNPYLNIPMCYIAYFNRVFNKRMGAESFSDMLFTVKWYGLKTDPYGTPYIRTEDDGEDELSCRRWGEQRKVWSHRLLSDSGQLMVLK